ncbi:arsenite efflux transporter metallochaperone ArsD [Rhodopirellula sallentina]|uniref:Arsenical resistance operon trans-acting repressor ArsD n=1 Tax=Rhodopirellula sallentina SM41 TaxID=1263870 RepID=M5UQ08_9BACT|nr:arsenite efflux transporter metallochaperone ArsD [Rhodopirellula sallentina]EMI58078.1 arsenical resistance operon trans-acting repressor ArsD [Rhodopirellula sallentina SM41]
MSHVQIYDRAMCCSTGVCGPQVDPVLPRFAADLDWLRSQGHSVERFNLAQDALQFAQNERVKQMLSDEGVECLPLIIVDNTVVSRNEYPSRESLAMWTGSTLKTAAQSSTIGLPTVNASADESQPTGSEGCCDGKSNCC